MSLSALEEAAQLLSLIERRKAIFAHEYYQPYKFQIAFHNALGYKTDLPALQKVLMAGNQVGKTKCAAMEISFHATGNYPEWFKGRRFTKPVTILVGGKTNETVRDICQNELFGEPGNPLKRGTGTIPLVALGKSTSKPGVPNALDTVQVKHKSGGWSKVFFRAYEQGKEKHMGIRIDIGWPDEEPPQEIWSQYLRATIATNGIILMTFTPEEGVTEVVNQFMNDIRPGQALVNATWNDARHLTNEDGSLTPEAIQKMASFPAHERDMRTRGVPFMGSGLVFPFNEEQIGVDPIDIPRHWPQIVGIDFGFDHPFGAARLAWDRDNDIVYVTADYREARAIPAVHAAAIKPWGTWPVAWPHDGLNTEKGTGDELKRSYEDAGLKLLPERATNPPQAGQEEGEGGNSVEASLMDMYERMETGRWKVFKTCRHWFEEQRMYHRDKGKLIKLKDDVISASRYAHMMLRHARTESIKRRPRAQVQGVKNW
jgi:phage terminase large subunit-like protein